MKKYLFLICLSWSLSEASGMPEFGHDVPMTLRQFLTESLNELFQVQGYGATQLHQKIFKGSTNGTNYKEWFLDRVKKIKMTESCAITAKIDSEGEPGIIYLSRCVNKNPEFSQKFYWISILFHEARHLEPHNNNWKHEICLDASNQVSACDSKALGAFGVEKVLAYNIVKFCTNCSEDLKKQALEVFDDPIVWNKLKPSAVEHLELDLEEL